VYGEMSGWAYVRAWCPRKTNFVHRLFCYLCMAALAQPAAALSTRVAPVAGAVADVTPGITVDRGQHGIGSFGGGGEGLVVRVPWSQLLRDPPWAATVEAIVRGIHWKAPAETEAAMVGQRKAHGELEAASVALAEHEPEGQAPHQRAADAAEELAAANRVLDEVVRALKEHAATLGQAGAHGGGAPTTVVNGSEVMRGRDAFKFTLGVDFDTTGLDVKDAGVIQLAQLRDQWESVC